MLNIPDSIKALYQRDDVQKNFRVQFPNGELPDITNENVVAESVRLTESLCSQEVLKFGLTEAPVIEFETVGVANMYGMKIECFSEIDTSSLTAAQIADIQAMTDLDGELVLEADSDLGWGFYRLPLGVFHVDSCPRSHGQMSHRKVTAYGELGYNKVLQDYGFYGEHRRSRAHVTIGMANHLFHAFGVAVDATPEEATPSEATGLYNATEGGVNTPFRVVYYCPPTAQADVMYKTSWSRTMSIDECIEAFKQALIDCGGSESLAQQVAEAWGPRVFVPLAGYSIPTPTTQTSPVYSSTLYFAHKLQIRAGLNDWRDFEINPFDLKIVSYTLNTNPQITLNLEEEQGTRRGWYRYTFSPDEMLAGLMELYGQFYFQGRGAGTQKAVMLSKDSPESIGPSLYEELWWDEYDVSPIGAIKYTLHGDKEEDIVYQFGEGQSIYDMTGNFILEHLESPTEEMINGLLDACFIPNITDIGFTPTEMEGKGLPYIEPGDYLEIDSGDTAGGLPIIVGTYIMQHTVSGLQALKDSIASKGGEIIEDGYYVSEE